MITHEASHKSIINQNIDAGGWHLLGEFKDPRFVKVTNEADGHVILDAVKFERIGKPEGTKDPLATHTTLANPATYQNLASCLK